MDQGPRHDETAAGGHLHWHQHASDLVQIVRSPFGTLVAPHVAARNHLGAAVGLGEGVHRRNQGVADRGARAGQPVEAVVGVQALGGLAGVDLDRLGGGQQIARLQQPIQDRQHTRLFDQVLEHLGARHQGVDPLGLEPLEVVATMMAVLKGGQALPHRCDGVRAHEVRDHGKALCQDLVRVVSGVKGRRDLDHFARSPS